MTAFVQHGSLVTPKKGVSVIADATMAIRCDNQAQISAVLNCNCVSYDNESKLTYVGACFYNCITSGPSNHLSIQELPENPEMLINNYSICKYFHRTGLLCGDCMRWVQSTSTII